MAWVAAEDYLKLPEGLRAELIDGEIVPTPTPDPSHQILVGDILSALCDHLPETWSHRVLPGPCDVRIDEFNVLTPDVLVLPEGTHRAPRPWNIPLPVLVIEVIDPPTEARDRDLKPPLYESGGVREEWIVDPFRRTVEVYDFVAGSRTVFPAGDIATSQALPGFSVDVARLFDA